MKIISKFYNHLANDSLYRNSIYLMASTGVMAFFGFFFWMINARLFTPVEVGLATTIISAMGLISGFSLLGLNAGLIRYLPTSKRKNDKINTSFLVSALVTIIIAIVFLLGLKTFSPKLLFIKENLAYALLFVIFMVVSSLSNLMESVFIALRDAKYILIQGTIFSVLKIILSFSLVALGTYGIFSSWMLALTVGFATSFMVLIKKFGYKPKLIIKASIIKKIGRFSFGNYVAGFLAGLPTMILPLLITNLLSPEKTAYYYMAMMIANLLFIIPQATTQSLFAEGSHNGKELKQHVKKTARIIALILLPAILMTMFLGKYILAAYGKNYSTEGLRFLQLLALSSLFIALNSIFGTILKIEHKIKELILLSLISAVLVIGLSYLFISHGLLGIGIAWLTGNMIIGGIYFGYWTLYRDSKEVLNIHNLF